MILISCPHCGPRNASEFVYHGETGTRPDPRQTDPGAWRRYLHATSNPAGWTRESWHHRAGCRQFLVVERNTLTNEIRSVRASRGEGGA